MKKLITLFLILSIAHVPIFGQTKAEKKAIKKEKAEKEYIATKDLLESGDFQFIADWATTQRGKRISLTTNPNFIKFENGNVNLFLPYFGISQSAGYGTGGGIEYKGPAKDFNLTFDDKKQRGTIRFTAKTDKGEGLTFSIKVFKSGNTTVNVNSSNRNSISYSGYTKALEKE